MRNRTMLYLSIALAIAVVLLGWQYMANRSRGNADLHRVMQQTDKAIEREHGPINVAQPPTEGPDTVYITRTGECYHRDGCGSLSRSRIPISLQDAKDRGYRACRRCNPPE